MRRRAGYLAIWIAGGVILCGCVSKEEFYRDATLSRESAHKQWESRKDAEKQMQPVVTGAMSMEDCLKLTLTNNKALQKTIEEREAARGAEVGSMSAIVPSAAVTAQYERKDEVQSFSIGGSKIALGDVDNYSVGLRVTQPIFAGGSIPARINAGRLGALLADQTVRAAVQETVYGAQLAYNNVLLDQQLYAISSDAVKSAQAHLDSVKQKKAAGVASDFDVLRAEVELSNFTAELIQSRNAINVAKANLVKVMGVSQDSGFTLSDELKYAAYKTTMEEAVAAAYRNRPDLFSRELNIRQQKELLAIAKSTYYPAVSGFFQNTWAYPDPHNQMIIDWGDAWSAGVAATWPIFDGFSREGNIITQKARVKQSQIDLVDSEETALLELTRAILTIEDTAEFVESQTLNVSRAEEGLRLAEVGYREGVNTQVEVIDAQAALTTAKANHYQAIYSHIVAKLDLQKAMGVLTTFESRGTRDE